MFKLLVMAGAAVCALVPMAAANADTFTESVQFGPGLTDFHSATGTTAGPGGTGLYFFDSNGGTLNSITFSYNYAISSQISVTNTSAGSASGNARTQSGAQFGSNDAALTAALNNVVNNYVDPVDGTSVMFGTSTLSPIAADVRGTANTYSLASGGSTSFASTGSFGRSNYTITNASDLAAFSRAGGGTFIPLFTTLTGLVNSVSGGNVQATQVTTGQANLVISYNYTSAPPPAVPEPASWATMLAGFGVIGLASRRQRRTSAKLG